MPQSLDKFRSLSFAGTPPAPTRPADRWMRPVRQAPSPSLFAAPFRTHAPVISPADRLLLEEIFRRLKSNGNAYRPAALGRRIPACLRALHVRSPAEALRRLEQDPAALELVHNALLIGVTSFFRDTPVFAHLLATALPDLLRTSPVPRVLSVGCSDGAELYSLAIAFKECGATDLTLRGIDCRRLAIDRAKAAIYPASTLARVPPRLRAAYFDALPHAAQIKPALRALPQWHLADAFIHLPTPPYDFIACRNFVIYLEHPAAARLWRRIHSALRPGGLLLTGKAERPTAGFMRAGPCLFRKATP